MSYITLVCVHVGIGVNAEKADGDMMIGGPRAAETTGLVFTQLYVQVDVSSRYSV